MERKLSQRGLTHRLQRFVDERRQRYFKGAILGLEFVRVEVGETQLIEVGGTKMRARAEYDPKGFIKFSDEWVSSEAMCRMLEATSLGMWQEERRLLGEVTDH